MKPQSMTLDAWIETVCAELGISDLELSDDSMHIVLDLARDAAHQVQRPAAPLTTFLVGVAVGRGQSLGAAAAQATMLTGAGSSATAPSASSASSADSASTAPPTGAPSTGTPPPSAPTTPHQPLTPQDPPRPVAPPPPRS